MKASRTDQVQANFITETVIYMEQNVQEKLNVMTILAFKIRLSCNQLPVCKKKIYDMQAKHNAFNELTPWNLVRSILYKNMVDTEHSS